MQQVIKQNDSLVVSIKTAAASLDISTRHLSRLIAAGELASIKCGRRRLIPRKALVALLERLAA